MLSIIIKGRETFNEITNEFITTKDTTLTLEHSLVSISKWESKWHKSFLNTKDKTHEQVIDYVKFMTTNKVEDIVYSFITTEQYDEIGDYIGNSMTATTINDSSGKPNREIITSELIYYWMISLNIPFECQKWHLNRLLTLIKVCNLKNSPGKKMSKDEVAKHNRELNAKRQRELGIGG